MLRKFEGKGPRGYDNAYPKFNSFRKSIVFVCTSYDMVLWISMMSLSGFYFVHNIVYNNSEKPNSFVIISYCNDWLLYHEEFGVQWVTYANVC